MTGIHRASKTSRGISAPGHNAGNAIAMPETREYQWLAVDAARRMGQRFEQFLLASTDHGIQHERTPLSSRLGAAGSQCYRATMYTLGRFLQVVGLIIPPVAIVAELNHSNPGLMLKF